MVKGYTKFKFWNFYAKATRTSKYKKFCFVLNKGVTEGVSFLFFRKIIWQCEGWSKEKICGREPTGYCTFFPIQVPLWP